MKKIEIWADSFHEGVWCCENICTFMKKNNYSTNSDYINGFIPHYRIISQEKSELDIIVYGSYESWNPIPKKIKELIKWGKPDFIAYDSTNDLILFAVEETAATPTGNQAMQRCERQYGSARLNIPYWYLVSEYGEHIDGGVRRDNIWPSIAAIKLTMAKKTPCIVLHYSDIDNIEDYNSGKGLNLLFTTISLIIDNYINNNYVYHNLEEIIAIQYKEMIKFISSQWKKVIDFLPSENLILSAETPNAIARMALNKENQEDIILKENLLVWPLTNDVPSSILNKQKGKPLIKYDKLSELLEQDVSSNKCYILSNKASSGKPTKKEKIKGWIDKQKALFNKEPKVEPSTSFTMDISDFPETENGNIHVTTSKNIVYLYDKWKDLEQAIVKAYPRLKNKIRIEENRPILVYVSNSIKPGRLFGDPYTGQLSAYSTCFGRFDSTNRAVIIYFPHQVHTQAFNKKNTITKNKGTTLFTELTDYIIFNTGIAISLKDGKVL